MLDHFECKCDHGFYGDLCDNDLDECRSFPCSSLTNDAICTQGINSWSCTCPDGFYGLRCEFETNECLSLPCLYGVCIDLKNEYQCVCPAGYYGTNCNNIVQVCENSNPCMNEATCMNHPELDFVCVCQEGWTGVDCSMNVDDCYGLRGRICDEEGAERCEDLHNDFIGGWDKNIFREKKIIKKLSLIGDRTRDLLRVKQT